MDLDVVAVDGVTINDAIDTLAKEPQIDLQEKHTFIDGVYCRECTMPPGSLIIGHEHAKECVNILSSGRILLKFDMKDEWQDISAPYTSVTEPGSRKIIYVVEEATLTNVFRTDKTDLDDLYDECVVPDNRTQPYRIAEAVRDAKAQIGV